jgi:hypothetical protein
MDYSENKLEWKTLEWNEILQQLLLMEIKNKKGKKKILQLLL